MNQVVAIAFRSLAAYGVLAAGGGLFFFGMTRVAEQEKPKFRWQPSTFKTEPLVILDAGHGGHDGGAVANRLVEKDLTLDLAVRVRTLLESTGVKVIMTREVDAFIPLERRAEIANDLHATAFVSLHLNSGGVDDSDATGIETYYSKGKSLSSVRLLRARSKIPDTAIVRDHRGERLASVIQRIVCERTGALNRGVKDRSYTVVHRTVCPSVLVECGFMTHPSEAAKLRKAEYRDRLASGIVEGISTFLHAQEVDPQRGLEIQSPNVQKPGKEIVMGL